MHGEKNKTRLFLYGSMLLAVLLGTKAQDIAYYLYNNVMIPLLIGITLLTIFSIFFFIIPPLLVSKIYKDRKVEKKEFTIYLSINFLVGIMVSFFSIIVVISWFS